MSFPEQLKRARLSKGLTQQQVADSLGITNSTYCGYETGKRQPDIAKMKLLASVLDTTGDVLLETGFEQSPTMINATLKQILSDRKLKQADLCRMTGIQTSLMSEYISGKKSPAIGNAILIADALGISLDALVGKESYSEDSTSKTDSNFYDAKILEIYSSLTDENKKYLYGYMQRLLEEQRED